jgi:hypothetical protein
MLPAYREAKPKPAFVDAHIIAFFIACPMPEMSGLDWSQKNAWTWDELQEKMSPPQRETFQLWYKVRDLTFSTYRLTNSCQRIKNWWNNASRSYCTDIGSLSGIAKLLKGNDSKFRTYISAWAELFEDEVREATQASYDALEVSGDHGLRYTFMLTIKIA